MNTLSILESIYTGDSYVKAERIMVDPSEVNLSFKYDLVRFPVKMNSLFKLEFEPYRIDYQRYQEMLTRVKLRVGEGSPLTIDLFSKPEDLELFVTEYDLNNVVLTEPLSISNLLYNKVNNESCLSPLGILALLFRKSYGNEEFRRYVNSTLLKEYRKEKISDDKGVSHTIYIRDNYKERIEEIMNLQNYLVCKDVWSCISDFMVHSPYVFSWRD